MSDTSHQPFRSHGQIHNQNIGAHLYSFPYTSDIPSELEYRYINSSILPHHHQTTGSMEMDWESLQNIPRRISTSTLPLIHPKEPSPTSVSNEAHTNVNNNHNHHQIVSTKPEITGLKNPHAPHTMGVGVQNNNHVVQVPCSHLHSPWSSTSQHLLTPQYPSFPSITTPYLPSSFVYPNQNHDAMWNGGADGNDHQWRQTVLEAEPTSAANPSAPFSVTTDSRAQASSQAHPQPATQLPARTEHQDPTPPMLTHVETPRSHLPSFPNDRNESFDQNIHFRPPHSNEISSTHTNSIAPTPTQARFQDGALPTMVPSLACGGGLGSGTTTMDPKMTMWGRVDFGNSDDSIKDDRVSANHQSSHFIIDPYTPQPHPYSIPHHNPNPNPSSSSNFVKPHTTSSPVKTRPRRSSTSASQPKRAPLTTTTPLRRRRPAKLHLPPPSANMHWPIPQPLYSAPPAPISLDLLTFTTLSSGSSSGSGFGVGTTDNVVLDPPPKVDGWVRPEDRPVPPLGYTPTPNQGQSSGIPTMPTVTSQSMGQGSGPDVLPCGLPQYAPGIAISGMDPQPRSVPMSRTWSAPMDSRPPPCYPAPPPPPSGQGQKEYIVTPGVNGLKVIPWRPYYPNTIRPQPQTQFQTPVQPQTQYQLTSQPTLPIFVPPHPHPHPHAQIDLISGQIIPSPTNPLTASSSGSSRDWTAQTTTSPQTRKSKRTHTKQVPANSPTGRDGPDPKESSVAGMGEDEQGRVKCGICSTSVSRQSDLQRHMRKHTGETPFNCPYCDAQFARNDKLSNHIARHHSGQPRLILKGQKA